MNLHFFSLALFICSIPLISSAQPGDFAIKSIDVPADEVSNLPFERPYNFFLSAGMGYFSRPLHDVSLSPIDNSVQFQDISRWHTTISTGLVWNPFKVQATSKEDISISGVVRTGDEEMVQAFRRKLAVALLVNVFQLSFSENDLNPSVPIDVGFGIGFRQQDFLVLLTFDLGYKRQTRTYFEDQFRGQQQTLTFAGSSEPTQVLDQTDDRIFYAKATPSIGLKVAYAFSQRPKNK